MKNQGKTIYQKIVVWFQNKLLFVIIWLVLTSIITFFTAYKFISEAYRNSIGYKSLLYKKIQKLNTKQNIDYFKQVLGIPSIIKTYSEGKRKKFIFINEYYYIQANIDTDNNVQSFSVISRKKDFQPTYTVNSTIDRSINKKIFTVTLNKNRFYDFQKTITNDEYKNPYCSSNWWPKGFVYSEGYYLGGEGDYQSLYVGIDNDGYYENLFDTSFWENLFTVTDCKEIPDGFRKNIVNGFMLTNETSESALFLIRKKNIIVDFGIDQYDVGLTK